MKNERHSGRASRLLRPVLLAGAAAAVWLTLSATSAGAATGAPNDELSGRPGPALSIAAAPAAPTLLPPGSGGDSSGLLSPVLSILPGTVVVAGASIPAGAAVPSSAPADLASPAVELVDRAAAGVVQAASPVLAGLVTESARALDPLAVVLTGGVPLPTAPAILPAAPAPAVPAPDPGGAASAGPGPARADSGTAAARPDAAPAAAQPRAPHRPSGLAGPSPSEATGPAEHPRPDEAPATVPGIPGSAAGTSQPAPGSGATAAAETSAFELRPPSGTGSARTPLTAAPEPVSFDPGSSPD